MKKTTVLIALLLIILAIEGGYVCYNILNEEPLYISTSEAKVLIIQETSSSYDVSDLTQVRNAIRNGGMIRIYPDNDWMEDNFPSYTSYGAKNEDGYLWIRGAYLNYVASRGWILTDVSNNTYYFVSTSFEQL